MLTYRTGLVRNRTIRAAGDNPLSQVSNLCAEPGELASRKAFKLHSHKWLCVIRTADSSCVSALRNFGMERAIDGLVRVTR